MKTKTRLFLAACFLVPIFAVIATFYAGTFIPVGTFRKIENQPPVPVAADLSGTTKSLQVAAPKDAINGTIPPIVNDATVTQPETITALNQNGTVRVNNFG